MQQKLLIVLAAIALLYILFFNGFSQMVEGYYPWWRRRLPWWRRHQHRNWWYSPNYWRYSYYPYYSYY